MPKTAHAVKNTDPSRPWYTAVITEVFAKDKIGSGALLCANSCIVLSCFFFSLRIVTDGVGQ